jgi:hypothetical protein
MSTFDRVVEEQLPPGAQKSGDAKTAVGVIDDSLYTESDVLANQARSMARARRGIPFENGDDFSDQFTRAVRQHNVPKQYVHQRLSEETINQIQQGSQNRDQQYIGNNADWTGYYLEPLAKFVVPFDTPFRNMLPRTPSVGIDVENWRAITDVFGGSGPSVGSFILAQQTAPQKASYTWVNKSNVLRQIAFSDVVTIESELYGRMFEPDVRAKVASKLAPSLMLGQEVWYLNGAQNLWSPPPPNTPTTSTSGGTITAATYWIIVTAANTIGETLAWSISPASTTVPQAISVTTTGSTSTISFNIMRVPNATKYNVYVGSGSTQPANSAMWLQGASAQFGSASALNDPGGLASGYFTVTMTAAPVTSGTAYSTVVSAGNTAITFSSGGGGTPANQTLVFDGIQSLVYLNAGALSTVGVGGETATVKRVADTGGALAKSDIDTWLEAMYLNSRANPECLLVSVKDHKALTNIIMNNTNFRVNVNPTQTALSDMVGGGRATKWLNQTTGRLMDIIMVPYLMQGTIVAVSLTLPFQVAEIDKPPLRVSVNREMWALEYPPDQSHPTQWMYGTYSSETLVSQYLGGQGILTGIVTS